MSENPVVCGNCNTENPPGSDTCQECGQPLTRSAEEALVENEQAQQGGLIPGLGDGPGVGTVDGASDTYVPNTDTPVEDGLPTD